tara:strand:- start:112 stop:747 length:636 start_codon:yes stop_codon:yes gene_type:complete
LESLYRKVIDIAKQQYSISKHDLDVDLYRVEDLYNSVSHNQIDSKLWLIEESKKFLSDDDKICIIGAWYGVLSYMIRQCSNCEIDNCDLDPYTKWIGNKLVKNLEHKPSWYIGDGVKRYLKHKSWYTVLCSTSVEHIPPKRFNKILKEKEEDTLVILQSNNNSSELEHINIHDSIDNLLQDCYSLNEIYYSGSKEFKGKQGTYLRHMVIGK